MHKLTFLSHIKMKLRINRMENRFFTLHLKTISLPSHSDNSKEKRVQSIKEKKNNSIDLCTPFRKLR